MLDDSPRATFGKTRYQLPQTRAIDPPRFGPEIDIFSLGCTLYFAVMGDAPYSTLKRSEVESNFRAGIFPELPEGLETDISLIISKCWRLKYDSAADVVEDLAESLEVSEQCDRPN